MQDKNKGNNALCRKIDLMAPNALLCERTCFSKGCDDVYEKSWGGVCGGDNGDDE